MALTSRYLVEELPVSDIQIIISFLQKYSIDVLILSAIITLITNVIKRVLPENLSNFKGYIPFVLGIIFYFIYSFFIIGNISVFNVVCRGVQSGGVATLIYAFYKHILKSKGDVKGAISDLLKGIVTAKSSSDVAKSVSNLFKTELSIDEQQTKIVEILKENTQIDDELITVITKLILGVLQDKK